MKRRISVLAPAVLLVFAALTSGCGIHRLERRLDPVSRDFLSKVRYLITPAERRTFLNLPASERSAFIDEFWEKRDPDPDTEENEFKTQYFERIDDANHLFTDGGEPGWLQDRGRIYILLGPPSERMAYPRGMSFYGIPVEIWYYGFFPIYFIDPNWTGNYRLDPDNPVQLTEIMRTQLDWKPRVDEDETSLDFDFSLTPKEPEGYEVRIRIPYKKIWMSTGEKDLHATLTVSLLGEDSAGSRTQETTSEHPLTLTEAELESLRGKNHIITLTFAPRPETRVLIVTVANSADKTTASKRKSLKG
jgi:GWxTD domain-containing protein